MNTISQTEYPSIFDRVKAIIVDSIILIILMVVVTDIFSSFEHIPDSARIIAFIIIFGLYDPILTSFFGGTIGHKAIGIRVKQLDNPEKNILLHMAILRYLVKALLGWISLLTVSSNEKKQAIHDSFAGSIVVHSAKQNSKP